MIQIYDMASRCQLQGNILYARDLAHVFELPCGQDTCEDICPEYGISQADAIKRHMKRLHPQYKFVSFDKNSLTVCATNKNNEHVIASLVGLWTGGDVKWILQ